MFRSVASSLSKIHDIPPVFKKVATLGSLFCIGDIISQYLEKNKYDSLRTLRMTTVASIMAFPLHYV